MRTHGKLQAQARHVVRAAWRSLPLAVAFYGYDSLAPSGARPGAPTQPSTQASAASSPPTRRGSTRRRSSARRLAADPALQSRPAHARRTRARPVRGRSSGRTGRLRPRRRRAPSRSSTTGACSDRSRCESPIDGQLVILTLACGLSPSDGSSRRGRAASSPGSAAAEPLAAQAGTCCGARVAGREYRGLQTAPLAAPAGARLRRARCRSARSTPRRRSSEDRLLAALLASLARVRVVTYLLGRSIVAHAAAARATLRTRSRTAGSVNASTCADATSSRELATRVQRDGGAARAARSASSRRERNRMREATARFGEALVATHDPGQLVRVVVESAVESTGAIGGVVLGPDGEIARAGDPDAGAERIAFPLRDRDVRLRLARPRVATRSTRSRSRPQRVARQPGRRRARERPAAPPRRASGARRQPHRARQPAQPRGDAALRARARRALRRRVSRRVRGPRLLQARQRPVRSRGRRRGAEGVRRGVARHRPRERRRRPVGRRGVRACADRHRLGRRGAQLAERARAAIEARAVRDARRDRAVGDRQLWRCLLP